MSSTLLETRDAAPARRLPVPFVLVTGGKGGVGKTTIAANLAVQLARSGRRVLVADLDLGLANLGLLLGLSSTVNLEDGLAGRLPWSSCVVRGPHGLTVLPAGSGTAAMGRADDARRGELFGGLAELARGYDLVIGDGAAGIGPDVLAFAARADHVLAVTTPEPAALTDVYGLIKALHTHGVESGEEIPTPELFLNLVSGLDEAEQVGAKLSGVCREFLARSPRTAGWLPRSAAVQRSCLTRRPFTADTPGSGPSLPTKRAVEDRPETLERRCMRLLAGRLTRFFALDTRPAGLRAADGLAQRSSLKA